MGSSTFSRADVLERRLKSWKTKPIFLFLITASSSLDSSETSTPSREYLPLVGLSRQPRIFIKVDLPEPDCPITATKSPLSMLRETPQRAQTCTSPRL